MGFAALLALALFGLNRVGSAIDRNNKMEGRKVATLPSYSYEYSWLTNDKLLIQVPSYISNQGKNNYPVRFQILNIKDGSLDQLAGLNNWINNRESGTGVQLNYQSNAFSPDGKWMYASEMKWVGARSLTGTNQNWLVSLDGTKQVSVKTRDGFVKWLPASSGLVLSHYLGVGQAGRNKFSHYVLKPDNLNKHPLIPGVFKDQTIETASALVGNQVIDLITDYRPMGKQYVSKIDWVHLVKRKADNLAVETTGAKLPLPPHSEKTYAASCNLSPIGDQLLWTFQENFESSSSDFLLGLLKVRTHPEFIITDLEGKVVRTLPPLEAPSNVQWLPDGKHISYRSSNNIYIIDLD